MPSPSTSRPFVGQGRWWTAPVAGEEPVKRYGTVRFEPTTGLRLELFDAADDFKLDESVVVFGELLSGVSVSLLDCFPKRVRKWPISDGSHVELMANVLVHGMHVSNEGELRASEASLYVRGLPEMLSGHGPLPNIDETRRWTVTLGGASVEFVLSWDEWMEDTSRREELAAHVYVKLDEPLGLDGWTERWFRPLQHLVGFVTRGLALFESVELILRAHGVAAELHPAIRVAGSDEFWERRDIAVLRRQRPTTGIRERAPEGALIGPNDCGFEAFVAGFLELHARLGRSAPFLFQSLSAPSGFLETQLLSLTSAAEAFHRTQHPEPPLPEDTHKKLEQRLMDCLDNKQQRDVYRSPIHYANAPRQRKRFKELVSQTASVLPELAEPAKTMADKLADTRNLFTHLDEEGPAAVEGERLLRLLRRLRIVMELHVLLASGVGDAVAASLLRRAYTTKGGLG